MGNPTDIIAYGDNDELRITSDGRMYRGSVERVQILSPLPLKAPAATGMLASGVFLPNKGRVEGVRLQCGTLPTNASDAFSFNVSVGGLSLFSSNQTFTREENPSEFLVTTDDESTFTSYIDEVTGSGHAQLDALSTAANGDYFYVGYSEPFSGARLTMVGGEVNANAATLAGQYWTGSAWATMTIASDGTASGGATLAQTGLVTFTLPAAGNWALKTINDTELYWVRFAVSAAVSATTSVDTATVVRLANHYYTFTADQNQSFAAGDELRVICTEADSNAAGLNALVFGAF